MKIIKRERKVRLDELIKYVFDNDVKNKEFTIKNSAGSIAMDSDGDFRMGGRCDFIRKSDLFTITEEVEIDEDMKLDLVDIYKDYGLPLEVAFCKNISVKETLKLDKASGFDTKFIHIQNPDGSIGELIWSKERGLVD